MELRFNLIFCGLLGGILTACSRDSAEEKRPQRKDITEYVFATGVLEADERYQLVAQSDGYLVKVYFKENDEVSPNSLLAEIDNKANLINAASATQQLTIADFNLTDSAPSLKLTESNIEFAKKKYQQEEFHEERLRQLRETNSIAKVEYENAVLATQNALSSLNALKEQYKSLQQQAQLQKIAQKNAYDLSQTNATYNQLRAVVGGKVLKRYKQAGDFVRKGDVLAMIGNTDSIVAKVNVDENNISKVHVGQKVFMKINISESDVYEGRLTEILPVFDETSQSFVCKIIFISPPNFRIVGTQLEANIEVARRKNVLVIPRNYLDFGSLVNIKETNEKQKVETGIVSNEYVEVISGVTEKDILLPLKPR